jgi:hypothetical protein
VLDASGDHRWLIAIFPTDYLWSLGMTEKVKRLTPTPNTLRELFLKSGNLCAFPNCSHLMMNEKGVFISQICHIEAAEVGGERFNKNMSNEQRRSATNLMLMCYAHHQETNDVDEFTVSKLQKMKADHEKRFGNPENIMLEKFTDQTEKNQPSNAKTLERLSAVLKGKVGFDDVESSVAELAEYVDRLRVTPLILRRFIGSVSKRIEKMRGTNVGRSYSSGESILLSDLTGVLGSSARSIYTRADELSAYGFGDNDEIETNNGPKPAVRIRHLRNGWPLWPDLVKFCENAPEPIEVFTEHLDFARLDE